MIILTICIIIQFCPLVNPQTADGEIFLQKHKDCGRGVFRADGAECITGCIMKIFMQESACFCTGEGRISAPVSRKRGVCFPEGAASGPGSSRLISGKRFDDFPRQIKKEAFAAGVRRKGLLNID